MTRSVSSALLIVLSALAASPALAQFDTIFGNSNRPPRPPADVPSRPPADVPPPSNDGLLPPGPPPNSTYTAPRAGGVQTQPLPPPPGVANVPPRALGNVTPQTPAQALPGLPPGQRQPPGATQPASTPPAANTPLTAPPPDEAVIEPPAQKIPNPTAVFAGLDKITGRITTFDVQVNETVRFGALEVTPRACYTRPPTETQNTDGFVEVDEVTLQGELKRIFTGWMFAASPGLNAVEHPIYDVWLTDCKGAAPPVTAEVAPEPPPPQRPQRPAQQQQQLRRAPAQQQQTQQQLPPPPAAPAR